MLEKFKGKKTYITGAVGIISAVGAFLTGDLALADMLQTALISLIGMTLRAGITTAAK